MKIIAVSSVLNEADIIGHTVSHLLGEGVDQCIISDGGSTDDTIWGLFPPSVCNILKQEGPFDQGAEITRLAGIAHDRDADWIIPFDADEFWIDPLGGTIRSILEALPPECLKVHCAVFKHYDWDQKFTAQNPMGKVAFRPTEQMVVAWGNHDVSLGREGTEEHGLLEIRELQYRDYDHFYAKVQKARALFASWDVPMQHGHHMRELAEMPDEALPAAFLNLRSGDKVLDPIDFRGMR